MKKLILLFFIQILVANFSFSQTRREIQKLRIEYSKIKKPEISFDDFVKFKQRSAANKKLLLSGKTKKYGLRSVALIDDDELCAIGGFENLNDLNLYFEGGYDDNPTIPLDYNSFTQGISTVTNIGQNTSRQTIVPNVDDPTIQETLNSARSGNNALRLGNRINGHGVEFLSVDITVSSPIISFWYAMVLHDPSVNHPAHEIPFFEVRVIDASGNEINNVVNLGGNSNRIASNDPFVLQATLEQGVNIVGANQIRYKPWSCAQIDLSGNIGENVTIQFINSDCAQGGHMSYTYIDDIECSGCSGPNPTGNISFNSADSDCNENKICFDYQLPDNGISTGEINISLEVKGANNSNQFYNSGTLSSGSSFCFSLPANDVSNFGGSYDFVAQANFTLNGLNINTLNAGSWPDGNVSGLLNDCTQLQSESDLPICCPPMDSTLLSELFNHVPLGSGLSSQFELQFNHNPYFASLWQAYLDYIHIVDNSINRLVMHVRLIDAGNGTLPNDTYSPMVSSSSETWIWFDAGHGGTIYGNTNFFNATLNINHWYKIHTGIYTEPNDAFKDEGCEQVVKLFYRVQLIGGKLIGTLSDGKRTLRRIDLNNSSFMQKK